VDQSEIQPVRDQVVSLLLADDAARDPAVAEFRSHHLSETLLGIDEIGTWLVKRSGRPRRRIEIDLPDDDQPKATSEGFRIEPPLRIATFRQLRIDLLMYPDGDWESSVAVPSSGPIAALHALTVVLVERYRWTPAQATAFVLTGLVPLVESITTTIVTAEASTVGTGPTTRSRIILDIDPTTPPRNVEAAYRQAVGRRLEALWRAMVTCGLRRGEALGLTWRGFDGTHNTLEVTQQVVPTKGKPTLQPCKTTGSNRKLTLDEETVQILRDHRDRQNLERALAGDAYQDLDLVFGDELGHPLSPQATTRAFHALRKAAEVRTGRLHDLRHSRATHLLSSGVPIGTVSARLGHSSPVVTLNVYSHVLPNSDKAAVEALAAALLG
jgi:site-specific recombinase XerC